jgi:hypothetical protein
VGSPRKLATATQRNHDFRASVEHTIVNGAAQIEETATQLAERQELNFQATEHASLRTIALPRGFPVSAALSHTSMIHLFVKVARKVDEATNFVFVQLTDQEPGIYDKRHSEHSDYARRNKIDLSL